MKSILNILNHETDRNIRPVVHDSCRFPGHQDRLDSHTRRIRTAPCECGSGLAYAECCMALDRQRSEPGVHYTLPRSLVSGAAQRHATEDSLRFRAFTTLHRRSRDEHDLLVRFVRAVVESARPIKEPDQVLRWLDQFGRQRTKEAVE